MTKRKKNRKKIIKNKLINILAENFIPILKRNMIFYGTDAKINKSILFDNFNYFLWFVVSYYAAYIFIDVNINSRSIERLIYLMHSYYLITMTINIKYPNKIKDIVFNFLGLISLYNIMLSLNVFNMLELSSSYMISNITYYYISFLIFTSSYNFYEKITFITGVIYEIFKERKLNIMLKLTQIFILWFLLSLLFILPINNNKYSLSLILITNIILSLSIISLFIFIIRKKNISNSLIIEKLEFNKENINRFNMFFLNVFKIDQINEQNINNSIMHNILKNFASWLRIVPAIILIPALLSNNYYPMYFKKNIECINKNLKKVDIIELKNNNVLIKKIHNEKKYLEETSCERVKETFEINKINW